MSRKRTEGEVIARGRIRVDARRAVAKLREHLLVDLHDYALELARAAVCAGARRIDVRYDADDVVFEWTGAAIAASELDRLLDHVLADAHGEGAHAQLLRLLAIGVNAALGLGPAFVEVVAVDARGAAARARFTPAAVNAGRDVPVEKVDVALPAGTTRVHLQRGMTVDVMRRATLGGAPPELGALGAATLFLPAELCLSGKPWPRGGEPEVLAAIPLALPARRAELQLLGGARTAAAIVFCERGVRLASYSFAPMPAALDDPPLPVRVVIDADALPANASRSAVREDSELHAAALEAAQTGFVRLLTALAAYLRGGSPAGLEVAAGREAIEDAVGLFAAVASHAERRGVSLGEEVAALLSLPLLRDACGTPRTIAAMQPRGGQLWVHDKAEPHDAELAPWLAQVLWRRGRAAERALGHHPWREAGPLVEQARAAAERKRLFLSHAAPNELLPARPEHAARTAFEVRTGRFAGLRGEVALLLVRHGRGASSVRIFYAHRPLATRSIAIAVCPLPLDIALSWDDRLVATFGFDDVEDGDDLRAAIWYAVQIGVAEVARLPVSAETAPLFRAALGASTVAAEKLGLGDKAPGRAALLGARVWPTSEPGRFESAEALAAEHEAKGALCFVTGRTTGRAADGRPVLALGAEERTWLAPVLPRGARFVPYDRALAWGAVAPDERRARSDQALQELVERRGLADSHRLRFEHKGVRGVAVVARESRMVVLHAFQVLADRAHSAAYGPVLMIVDADEAMPNEAWDGLGSQLRGFDAVAIERQLVASAAAAASDNPIVAGYLVESATAIRARLWRAVETGETPALRQALEEIQARLLQVPLVTILDAGGRRDVSLSELDAIHPAPAPVPVLGRAPDFPTGDWRPVLSPSDGVVRWLGDRLLPAEAQLETRRAAAQRGARVQALLAQPPHDPWAVADAAPGARILRHEVDGVTVAVALPAHTTEGIASVEVLFRERFVRRLSLFNAVAVTARVGLSDEAMLLPDASGPSSLAQQVIRERVLEAAGRLALELVRADALDDARVVHLVSEVLREVKGEAKGKARSELVRLLRGAARFGTVQGDRQPLAGALAEGEPNVVLTGKVRFAPWAKGRKTRLDDPILHLTPTDHALDRLLRGLGLEPRDMSSQIAALQGRRGGGAVDETVQLSGAPSHPSLRASVGDLGSNDMEGEIEIGVDHLLVTVTDLEGPRPFVPALEFPLRGAVRIEALRATVTDADLEARLRRATRVLCARAMKEAPTPAVRATYRALLAAKGRAGQRLSREERKAEVLEDIAGGWHSVGSLAAAPVGFTTLEPPFTGISLGRTVLRLSAWEASALSDEASFEDEDARVNALRDAIVRRNAIPFASMTLPDDVRALSVAAATIADGGLTGEVGVRAPDGAARRGIELCHGGRVLCVVEDGDGWPLAARVEASFVAPNDAFDGPVNASHRGEVARRVRKEGLALLRARWQAPPDALATCFVAGQGAGDDVAGLFWLPASFPRAPRVTVHARGLVGGQVDVAVRHFPTPCPGFDPAIPVAGEVMAIAAGHGDVTVALARAALAALEQMVAELGLKSPGSRAHALYGWNLALLHPGSKVGLTAPIAGGEADAAAVGAELWRSGGLAVGGRDLEALSLVAEPDSPLLEVLAMRAPGMGATAPAVADEPVVPEAPPVIDEGLELADPWFAGLARRVLAVFRPPPARAPVSRALPDALLAAIERLALPEVELEHVVFARRGRPLRYEPEARRLVIHRDHPAVLALWPADAGEPSAAAVASLAAAAVSEINRASRAVTDAEERLALVKLLRAR